MHLRHVFRIPVQPGLDFPDSAQAKRLAVKERFFTAKAKVAKAMEEAKDAAFEVRDTENLTLSGRSAHREQRCEYLGTLTWRNRILRWKISS